MSKVETIPSDEEPVAQQPVVDQLSDAELDVTAGGTSGHVKKVIFGACGNAVCAG